MFGTNRTVLRVGAGSSIDTEFGALRARLLTTNVGEVSVNQTRGQAPTISFGNFTSLPTLRSRQSIAPATTTRWTGKREPSIRTT